MARRDPLPPLSPTRAFEATGRLLSISKAADELSVTPAAVSRQVRALEDFLQASLFERVHGGLVLTSAGARTRTAAQMGRVTQDRHQHGCVWPV
jgi:LysR family transcriptional regulator, glycine cleavage system transcriptional activator